MKYIHALIYSLLIIIGCSNDSTVVQPTPSPEKPCPPSRTDTVKVYIPIPDVPTLEYVNIKDIGCKPDDQGFDNGKVISNYIASRPAGSVVNIFAPEGKWHILTPITAIDRALNLQGAGMHKTIFYVADGSDGIFVTREKFAVAQSIIGNFTIDALGKSVPGKSGIKLWQRGTIINVDMQGYSQYGIYISGSVYNGSHNNANGSVVFNVEIALCDEAGFFTDGSDGNAGYYAMLNIHDCKGYGIWSSSFLGESYYSPMLHHNQAGSIYVETPTANTTIVGAYIEADQPLPVIKGEFDIQGGRYGSVTLKKALGLE